MTVDREEFAEASAAFAMVTRLAVMLAAEGRKDQTLKAIADCVEALLEMERPAAARLLEDLHGTIGRYMADDSGLDA
jgi:hypothetical protein